SVRKPEHYPPESAVAISTHDLPPLSSFWSGADIELRDALGLWPTSERRAAETADRPGLRAALEAAFRDAGAWSGEPRATEPPIIAAHAFLARTPSRILVVNPEDALGARRQANVPGTVDEHPNWRHRLAVELEDLFADRRLLDIAGLLGARSFAGLLDYE